LPASESGKFLKMVANTKTPKDVARAMKRIDNAVDAFQRKTLINSIKREMQRVQASKAIAIDYRWRVNNLMSDILYQRPKSSTMLNLLNLENYIRSQMKLGRDVTVPQYVLSRLKTLTSIPLAELRTVALEDILGEIRTLAELGKTKLATKVELDHLQKQKDLADLAAVTMPMNSREVLHAAPGQELTKSEGIKNLLSKSINLVQHVDTSIMPMDVLFD